MSGPRKAGSHPAAFDGLVVVICLIATIMFVLGFVLGRLAG